MKSTKFLGFVLTATILGSAAFFGKFTGDLGLYITGAYACFAGGNTLISRAAMKNGNKEPAA